MSENTATPMEIPHPHPEVKRQYAVTVKPRYSDPSPTIHRSFFPKDECTMAMDLARHFGVIAAKPEGDDLGKLVLLSPEEVVSRACAIAEEFYRQTSERGWYVEVPLPEDDE